MVQSAQVNANGTTQAVALGPFYGGLHNSSGTGEFIEDRELFDLVNMEVDTDKSLVNRPAIKKLNQTVTSHESLRLIGKYLPNNGSKYLVIYFNGTVRLLDPATGQQVGDTATVTSNACLQFGNRMYVVPLPGSGAGHGGYFDGNGVWHEVPAIPNGESIVAYKQRLWIAAGVSSEASTASQVRFSGILDGTTWSGTDVINVESGNGEKMVYMVVLFNDIILFKQHSTYRFGYSSDPLKAELSKISDTIGTPSINCAVTYDNNNVYVLHDNSVYELSNYSYTKLSYNIKMAQDLDPSIYASDIYGLTLYRNRLFVRYYKYLYVFSLLTRRWSRWESERKFSKIVYIPSADIGLDTAYAATASIDTKGEIYFFQDNRTSGVGTDEKFKCSIQTKTFDLDIPHAYKVMMFWGMTIATLGVTEAKIIVPNAGKNPTWDDWKATYTWDSIKAAGITWSMKNKVVFKTTRASELGGYAKKFLKFNKKLRFRQAFITVDVDVVPTTADAGVRIFDITVFVSPKQLVSKATT